jgi:hypothetical protein
VTRPAKLLFDECIGWPIVDQLRGVIGIDPQVTLEHVIKLGFGGENDEDWIPKVAAGGWVLVTGDRGVKKKGRGEKLPTVCGAYGVTYAVLSRSLVHLKAFDKYRLILEVWDKLVALKDEPPGSGFSIRRTKEHYAVVLFRPPPPPPPGVQLTLPSK